MLFALFFLFGVVLSARCGGECAASEDCRDKACSICLDGNCVHGHTMCFVQNDFSAVHTILDHPLRTLNGGSLYTGDLQDAKNVTILQLAGAWSMVTEVRDGYYLDVFEGEVGSGSGFFSRVLRDFSPLQSLVPVSSKIVPCDENDSKSSGLTAKRGSSSSVASVALAACGHSCSSSSECTQESCSECRNGFCVAPKKVCYTVRAGPYKLFDFCFFVAPVAQRGSVLQYSGILQTRQIRDQTFPSTVLVTPTVTTILSLNKEGLERTITIMTFNTTENFPLGGLAPGVMTSRYDWYMGSGLVHPMLTSFEWYPKDNHEA